jgi:hypothetical protein
VQAMLRSIIMRREGHTEFPEGNRIELTDKQQTKPPFRIQQLFKKPKAFTTGVINGMLRTLHTSKQNSPLGMALKGLRG